MKITIDIRFSLEVLKNKYRVHHGKTRKDKVSRREIAIWLGSLSEADVEMIDEEILDIEENSN